MNDLISIVIPVFNVEEYLSKCVNSCINQTYKNIEIIIVDDCSPDNSGKIADQYALKDDRIKVIHHKKNGGLSAARNTGIDNSNGKYITFIDSDDFINLNYIEILYKNIIKYDADICIGSHKVIYPKGIIDKSTGQEYNISPKDALKKILYQELDLSSWGKLFKTDIVRNIKFPVGRLYEDSATTYLFIDSSSSISVVSQPLYNYIIRKDSISQNKFTLKKMDLIKSTEEMANYISGKYPDLQFACKRKLMQSYLSTLVQLENSNTSNKKIENYLLNYINQNKKEVLNDKNLPRRDVYALRSLSLGLPFFKFAWKLYSIFTKRR